MIKNIENIKEKLPHGAQKEIALRSGRTVFTVNRVINGKSNNADVIKALKDYLVELSEVKKQLQQYIEQD